jgi:hypothetical protein
MRSASRVLLVVLLVGCSTEGPSPTLIRLLTASATEPYLCPASLIVGDLVVDQGAGTAIVANGERFRVRWPPRYVGRQVGGEVEVLDPSGKVIATTGRRLQLGGGAAPEGVWQTCEGLDLGGT